MKPSKSNRNSSVQSETKKIEKTNSISKNKASIKSKEKSTKSKVYNTHDELQKKNVVVDLIIELGLQDQAQILSAKELLEHLDRISLENYNKILAQVLGRHFTYFSESREELKIWRRKLKGWIISLEKPEMRGSWVVRDENLEEFKKRLVPILQTQPTRCFESLREKLIGLIEALHYENQGKGGSTQPFNRNTCSKHFWYDFLQRNPDIMELWEKIPSMRTLPKKKTDRKSGKSKPLKQVSEDDEYGWNNACSTATLSPSQQFAGYYNTNPDAEEGMTLDYGLMSTMKIPMVSSDWIFLSSHEDNQPVESEEPEEQMEPDAFFEAQTLDAIPEEEKMEVLEEETEEVQEVYLMSVDENEEVEPKFDFYSAHRMIVETEENEVQKEYFRQYCRFGMYSDSTADY